jgi:tetratricopeptide (TPR) repeat protein
MTQPGRPFDDREPLDQATVTSFMAASELRSGDVVGGRYRIEGLLGMGGMGLVYRAWDIELQVAVALKLLRPELASRANAFERFRQELLLARQVSSPHVVRIHDLVRHEGAWMISMDFVDGESLERRLDREGSLPAEEALRITREIALGLAAAHHRGVIHRDLKPANILLTRTGEALITDFGVARSAGATGITGSGVVIGTPAYLSPEQARADPIDGRSDLYALGLILYELLTGVLPFRNGTAAEMLAQRLFRVPDPPNQLQPGLPPLAVQLCAALLEIRPSQRLQSADAVATAIASGRLPGRRHRRPQGRWLWAATATLALAVGGALAWPSLRPLLPFSIVGSSQAAPRHALALLPWVGGADAATDRLGLRLGDVLATELELVDGLGLAPLALVRRVLEERGFDAEAAPRHRAQVMQALNVLRGVEIRLSPAGEGLSLTLLLFEGDADAPVTRSEATYADLAALGRGLPAQLQRLLRGRASLPAGSAEAASASLAAALETPDQATAAGQWLALSEAALSQPAGERRERAQAALQALDGRSGRQAERVRLLARAWLDDADAEPALAQWLATRADPLLALAHIDLLTQAGELDAALAIARALTEQDPGEPAHWFALGKLSIIRGEARPAVDDYLVRALVQSNRLNRTLLRGDISNAMGLGHRVLGQIDSAVDLFEQAARLRGQAGDTGGEAAALMNLSSTLVLRSDFAPAEAALAEAERLAEPLGDRSLLADIANDRGVLYEERGEFRLALDAYRKALAERQAGGDARLIVQSLINAGYAYYHLGEFDNAQVYWQQAETQSTQTQDLASAVRAGQARVLALLARGDFALAAQTQEALLLQAESQQLAEDIRMAHVSRAEVAHLRGELATALESTRRAEALANADGDLRVLAQSRLVRVHALLDAGLDSDADAALQALRDAPPASVEQQAEVALLEARLLLSAGAGAGADALAFASQALALAQQAYSQPLQAQALLARAIVEQRLGRADDARATLGEARAGLDRFPSQPLRLLLIETSLRIGDARADADYREARAWLARSPEWMRAPFLHLAAQRAGVAADADASGLASAALERLLPLTPAAQRAGLQAAFDRARTDSAEPPR